MADPRDLAELEQLRELRTLISRRIKTLENRSRNRSMKEKGGLTVRSKDLKPFLQEWIDQGRPLVDLARKAVVSDKVLYDIMRGDTRMTTDLIADSILTALNCSPVVLEELRQMAREDKDDYH